MKKREQNLIEETLKKVGLKQGDIVLVHSDSTAVREITGINWADALNLLKNCFLNVLGESGTLVVPTFNWDFCKGKTYIHEKTRSQVGMFTNYVLFDDRSIRSFHPIYSFAAIGPMKNDVLNNVPKSSYGNESVFHRLHKLNAKIILFNFDLGTTFVHYVEQKLGVDYRYIKYFTGKVSKDGFEYEDTFDFYVRYLDRNVVVNLSKLHEYLHLTGKMMCAVLNGKYQLMQVRCNDIYQVVSEKLETDPYFLLEHTPKKPNQDNNCYQ